MIPPLLYFQASDGQGESEQQSQGQEILGGRRSYSDDEESLRDQSHFIKQMKIKAVKIVWKNTFKLIGTNLCGIKQIGPIRI